MKLPSLRVYALAYLLFLYAPIILLPLFAFNDGTIIAFPLKGFTTEWFGQMFGNSTLRRALGNSLIIATSTAVFATTFGIFAARASTRFNFPGKGPVMGLIMLPLVLPEVIVSVSLLVVLLGTLAWFNSQIEGWVQDGFPAWIEWVSANLFALDEMLAENSLNIGLWSVILGHILIATPYAIAILQASFNALDRSLEEAAYDLGETKLSTFRLITLPLVMPGIVSAFLISFTISLDEFIIAFFLAGNEPTLPTYIFSQLRFPKSIPMIMALGTCLVAASILLLTIAEYYRRRGLARTGAKDTGGFL